MKKEPKKIFTAVDVIQAGNRGLLRGFLLGMITIAVIWLWFTELY